MAARYSTLLSVVGTALLPSVLALTALFWGLTNTYQLYRSNDQELKGLLAARHVYHAISDLQLMRNLLSAPAGAASPTLQRELRELEDDLLTDLTDPNWHALSTLFGLDPLIFGKQARALVAPPRDSRPPRELLPQYDQLIDQLSDALQVIADHSQLVLDPDFRTYYLIDIALRQLPLLSASYTALQAKRLEMTRPNEASWRYLVEAQTLLQLAQRSVRSLDDMDIDSPAALGKALAALESDLLAWSRACSAARCPSARANASASTALLTEVRTSKHLVDAAFIAASDELERLLSQRRSRYAREMAYTLVIALAAVLSTFAIALYYSRKLRQSHDALQQLSETDALTGIPNRRTMDERFSRALSQARRLGQCFALGMVDIDHFKRYNDLYGHQEGDAVLRSVAACLRHTLQRGSDHFFRYGGEEFCFFLTPQSLADLQQTCLRIRATVQSLGLRHEQNPPAGMVTVSIGTVFLSTITMETQEQLISAADKLLYAAKKNGRNRCELGILEQDELTPYQPS